MTEQEFKSVVDSIELPHTYMFFPANEVPRPLYFVWYFSGSDNFGADDVVFTEIMVPVIELYSKTKSFTDEKKIEAVLKSNGFFWQKNSEFIDSEQMHMTSYEIGEIANG